MFFVFFFFDLLFSAQLFYLFLLRTFFIYLLIFYFYFSNTKKIFRLFFIQKIYKKKFKKWTNYLISTYVQQGILTHAIKLQLEKGPILFFNKIQFQILVKKENLKTFQRSAKFSAKKKIYRVFLILFLNVKKERMFSTYTKENRKSMHYENLEMKKLNFSKNEDARDVKKKEKVIEKEKEKEKEKKMLNRSEKSDTKYRNYFFYDRLDNNSYFDYIFNDNISEKFKKSLRDCNNDNELNNNNDNDNNDDNDTFYINDHDKKCHKNEYKNKNKNENKNKNINENNALHNNDRNKIFFFSILPYLNIWKKKVCLSMKNNQNLNTKLLLFRIRYR